MRTINTPTGIIMANGGDINFFQTLNPTREDFITVQSLDEFAMDNEAKQENLSIKHLTQNTKSSKIIDKSHFVKVSDSRALKDLMHTTVQSRKTSMKSLKAENVEVKKIK